MLKKLLYPIFRRLYNIDSLVPKRFKFGLSTFLYLSFGVFYILVYATNISFEVSALFALISCLLFIYPLVFGIVRGYDFSKILPVPIIFIFSSFFILNYLWCCRRNSAAYSVGDMRISFWFDFIVQKDHPLIHPVISAITP